MTTIEQLGGLTAQHNEIIKRVVNGSLDPFFVKRALQDIIEGISKAAASVVDRVEYQLGRWRQLGVIISDEQEERVLQQADVFESVTNSDEPLVTGGFGYDDPARVARRLFEAFTPTNGYPKYNYLEDAPLRYTSGMEPTGELRLVHFDPNAYAGLSPEQAVTQAKSDNLRLAGIEVLERLALEPATANAWDGKQFFFPNLSGLQRKYDDRWSDVPCLSRGDDARRFKFDSLWAGRAAGPFSSPVVREC